MKTILNMLDNERFELMGSLACKDPEHKAAGKKITGYMDKFQEKMSKEDFTDLQKLSSNIWEQYNIESKCHFSFGFRLATLILFEVFADDFGMLA